tara:strand:+ start:200 stop:433 length:234 start_codon:yes stop_codon:yes gene_type:complete
MERNIKYQNKNNKIIKFYSESEYRFSERLNFIKKLEKNNLNFKEAVRISKIWSNIKFKDIKYQIKIFKLVKKYDSKI